MDELLNYLIVILMTTGVIFGGKAFWDWKKNRTPRLDLKELEAERAQYLQENFDKAIWRRREKIYPTANFLLSLN